MNSLTEQFDHFRSDDLFLMSSPETQMILAWFAVQSADAIEARASEHPAGDRHRNRGL